MARSSNLVPKPVQVTRANGTTFTRMQMVRPDTVEDAGTRDKLSSAPKLVAGSSDDPELYEQEVLQSLSDKLKKKYDLTKDHGTVSMDMEDLSLHLDGLLLSEGGYREAYTDATDEYVEKLIDELLEDLSDEDRELMEDNDIRTKLHEEIRDREDMNKVISDALAEFDEVGVIGTTGVKIPMGHGLSDKELQVEALSISNSLGLGIATHSQYEDQLIQLIKNHGGSEIAVSWDEQPSQLAPKATKGEEFVSVSDPIIFAMDSFGSEPHAIQLIGSNVTFKRSNMKVEEGTISDSFYGDVMIDGYDAVASGTSTFQNENTTFQQNSDPLF